MENISYLYDKACLLNLNSPFKRPNLNLLTYVTLDVSKFIDSIKFVRLKWMDFEHTWKLYLTFTYHHLKFYQNISGYWYTLFINMYLSCVFVLLWIF